MNLRYRDYAVKLIAFAFFPIWLVSLGLTYVSAESAERPSIIVLALSVAVIVGVITVVAPLIKLWLLGRGSGSGEEISGTAIVAVTIVEAILMLGAMLIAIWFISIGGPLTRLNMQVPEGWLFACVFIVSSGFLALVPNLALLGSRGPGPGNAVRKTKNLVYVGLLGLISPSIVTLTVAGFSFFDR